MNRKRWMALAVGALVGVLAAVAAAAVPQAKPWAGTVGLAGFALGFGATMVAAFRNKTRDGSCGGSSE